jgi:hypothetical protein
MQCFLGCSSLLLYGVAPFNELITQRTVVQTHPPHPLTRGPVPIGHRMRHRSSHGDQSSEVASVTFLVIDKQRFAYYSRLAPKSSNSIPFQAGVNQVAGPVHL